MESALSVAACGRVNRAQPCDGGGGELAVRDDPSSSASSLAPPAPFLLITDRLDTPGGAGSAVFDRAWTELAALVATGRAQASRVGALALERPPAVYGGRGALLAAAASAASVPAAAIASVVRVVDGYTDPFGWVGGEVTAAAGGGGKAPHCRVDDLDGLARALCGGESSDGGDGDDADDTNSVLVVIDSLSALLARHATLDVLRWLDTQLLRSPRVSAVLAMQHADEDGGVATTAAAGASSPSDNTVTAAFEALASASLQLRPLTPAQRDLCGADGELRVVCRRRGGGAGVVMAAAAAAAAAAAGSTAATTPTTSAVDSTRVFGGAGRPRAERLLYTLGYSGFDEDEGEGEPQGVKRWRRAAVALAPMPREVAAPDARTLAARAAERAAAAASSMAQKRQQQQQQSKGPEPPSGQRHDRLAARTRAGVGGRVWAPLGGAGDAADASAAAAQQGPGRILFERDSGGSSAESGADPDEDLEI